MSTVTYGIPSMVTVTEPCRSLSGDGWCRRVGGAHVLRAVVADQECCQSQCTALSLWRQLQLDCDQRPSLEDPFHIFQTDEARLLYAGPLESDLRLFRISRLRG